MFESVAERELWPKEEWASILAPFLSGEPLLALQALTAQEAQDYCALRSEILARVGMSPSAAAIEHHKWTYRPGVPPRNQMTMLLRLTSRWLEPGTSTPEEVAEKVAVDRYVRALPPELRKAVALRGVQSPGARVYTCNGRLRHQIPRGHSP
uniref:SCAN box domain-containing protein n=1 Tax=Astyanax mexicanus TaxID=7994 RepID=A0A3B1JXN8_ASTMX